MHAICSAAPDSVKSRGGDLLRSHRYNSAVSRIASRVLLTVLIWTAAATAHAATGSLKLLPPGPRPIAVSVGTYLIDFQKIDESTLTHTIVVYLTLQWRDPRLAKDQLSDLDPMAITLDQIWHPNIEVTNLHSPREVANSMLTLDDDGTVTYEERFKGELSTDFELQRFPFDRQMLLLQIESFRFTEKDVKLVVREMRELKSPGAFLPDWDIFAVSQHIDTDNSNPDQLVYSRYTFDIEVVRKRGYYVWNVFLPLLFITLLVWAVFFITPEDIATRTTVSITALLTAIAFSLVISGTRPRVSYLTFMDAVFLNAYFLIFVTTASVIVAHFLIVTSGNTKSAERLSRIGQLYFPLFIVLTNAALALKFLL